jgi:cell shape-determining protein MreD
MPSRPSRLGVALTLLGVLVLFVSVIAQLATSDGLAQTLWVVVSIIGACVIVAGIATLIRASRRSSPPED